MRSINTYFITLNALVTIHARRAQHLFISIYVVDEILFGVTTLNTSH